MGEWNFFGNWFVFDDQLENLKTKLIKNVARVYDKTTNAKMFKQLFSSYSPEFFVFNWFEIILDDYTYCS